LIWQIEWAMMASSKATKAGPSEEYDKTRGRSLTNNLRKSSIGVIGT